MKNIYLILGAILIVGCSSEGVNLDSAIKASRNLDFDKSISLYESLVSKEPNNALYYNNLGWVLFRNGNFEKAKEQLELAKELDSDNSLSESIQTNLNMVSEYASSKNTLCNNLQDRAGVAYLNNEDDFEVSFKYNAKEIGYMLLGECFLKNNDKENSIASFSKIVEIFTEKDFESSLKMKAENLLKNS